MPGAYNSSYSYDMKESMQKYVKNINYDDVSASWYTDNIAGKNFLIRVLGLDNAFSVCIIDFDLIVSPSQSEISSFEPGFLIYFPITGFL